MSTVIETQYTSGLTRNASTQSNTSSGGTAATTHLMTPASHHPDIDDQNPDEADEGEAEEELTDHELDEMYANVGAARARMGQATTRSMQNLKGEKGAGMARTRSMSDSRHIPPPIVIPTTQPVQPVAIAQTSNSSTSAKQTKSSKSFSAFLRRLTGKGPKKDKAAAIPAPVPAKSSQPTAIRQSSGSDRSLPMNPRPVVTRQETAPSMPASNSMPYRRPTVRQNSMPTPTSNTPRDAYTALQPLSAPIQTNPLPTFSEDINPADVPLPVSPTLPDQEEVLIDTLISAPPSQASTIAVRRSKPSPMLSLEGFDMENEETDEEADQVLPLQPLRITTKRSNSPGSGGPKTGSSVETTIKTPTSATSTYADHNMGPTKYSGNGSESDGSPEKSLMGISGGGNSSPSKAGNGGLDRKGSKWRKSVMNISESLNGGVVRKQTTTSRPPPSSHDSYMSQQRRMANNRISCQPTVHNNNSIGAKLTAIKDKEEQETAETFFLS